MVRNKGKVLSRDQIEQHIWDYDYMGSSNMIDVYIRYLRKKINKLKEKIQQQTAKKLAELAQKEAQAKEENENKEHKEENEA